MKASEDATIATELVGEARHAHKVVHEHVEERVPRRRERIRSATSTRKSVETRRRIMETAEQLLLERGNTAFRMSEVSRRCGMSKGALYYYFADKEDLLEAIYSEEIDQLVQTMDQVVEEAESAVEALRGICNAYAGHVLQGGSIAMALMRELVIERESESGRSDERMEHIAQVVMSQIERAIEEGVVRADVTPRVCAMAVCGAFSFVSLDVAKLDGAEDKAQDFADELFNMVVRGIRA